MDDLHQEQRLSDERGSSFGLIVTFAVFLLPVLYVLSIGPVAMIVEKMGIDRGPFQVFYVPVIWLHDHTFLEQPLEWYVSLWGVR